MLDRKLGRWNTPFKSEVVDTAIKRHCSESPATTAKLLKLAPSIGRENTLHPLSRIGTWERLSADTCPNLQMLLGEDRFAEVHLLRRFITYNIG